MMTKDDFLQMDEDQLLLARDDIMARKRANGNLMAWATSVPGKREIEEISVRREAIRDEYGQALLDLARGVCVSALRLWKKPWQPSRWPPLRTMGIGFSF